MKKTVVLYPGLGVGHLVPMVEVAKLFLKHGLAVTMALVEPQVKSTDFSAAVARARASNPSVAFHVLPTPTPPPPADANTDGAPRHHVVKVIQSLAAMNAPLRDFLRSLPSVHALVLDMFCVDALDVAAELKLPVYYSFASGAGDLAIFLNLPSKFASNTAKDIPSNDDNAEHGYYDEDEEFEIKYEKTMRNLSLMANLRDYMAGGKERILDTGCTDHMTEHKDMFHEIASNRGPRRYVTFGGNSKGKVPGLGKVAISYDSFIQNVMLAVSLGYNLLFVSRLADFGFNVLFTKVDCQVFCSDNHNMVFAGFRRGDLYSVDFTKKTKPCTCLIAKSSKGWLWHRRLGHVGMRNLDRLIKGDHIPGVKDVIFAKDRLCSACQPGKQVGGSYPVKNIMTTRRPLEAQRIFKNFARKAQNQFEMKFKKVRSSNRTEFKNKNVDTFLDEERISHEFSAT